MQNVSILVAVLALLLLLGWLERRLHRRRLAQIPIRIHVNGSRGKSSVTRLIAAGLRSAGIITCAKTTGTLPRMILPSGEEQPIPRGSRPHVMEQLGVVRIAAALKAEALVVECMALTPSLQWLSQWQLIRATHGVITSVKEDHLDVMGPTERDVAWALAGMIPPGGTLFSADERHADVFRQAAEDRRCRIVEISPEEVAAVTPAELARFRYHEHTENVALALAVCRALGVDRDRALAGMWQAAPDPGALTEWHWRDGGRQFWLVSGFAANDPQSSGKIWAEAVDRFAHVDRRIALINCRADRPQRSWRLGQAVVDWPPADVYLLCGGGMRHFMRPAARAGLDMSKVVVVAAGYRQILDALGRLAGSQTLIVGLGNIGGLGLELIEHLQDQKSSAQLVSG
jgi:poly-gamma-glutamate synthase PgsB/CapB